MFWKQSIQLTHNISEKKKKKKNKRSWSDLENKKLKSIHLHKIFLNRKKIWKNSDQILETKSLNWFTWPCRCPFRAANASRGSCNSDFFIKYHLNHIFHKSSCNSDSSQITLQSPLLQIISNSADLIKNFR